MGRVSVALLIIFSGKFVTIWLKWVSRMQSFGRIVHESHRLTIGAKTYRMRSARRSTQTSWSGLDATRCSVAANGVHCGRRVTKLYGAGRSGRYAGGGKASVEGCRSIDVLEWHRRGYLRHKPWPLATETARRPGDGDPLLNIAPVLAIRAASVAEQCEFIHIRLGFCQTDQPSTAAGRSSLSRSSMVSIRSSLQPAPLAPVHCTPQALPSASASNCPSLHHHERGSPMKNRKREICTSGSVRDEDGQPPHLLGRRTFLHLVAGAAALPAVSRFAWAQAYPSRPVRIIVGFAPGGATDIMARLIGQWLSERLGQQFVVENRPSATGNIATEAVVRSPPDRYTLLLAHSVNAINATFYDKLNFDLIRDIAPVASIHREPNVMEVNPSVPVKTVPEFIRPTVARNAGRAL